MLKKQKSTWNIEGPTCREKQDDGTASVICVFSASVREPKFDAGASFLLPGVSSPVRMHSAPVSVFVDVRRFR
jgi:hypothetical protein